MKYLHIFNSTSCTNQHFKEVSFNYITQILKKESEILWFARNRYNYIVCHCTKTPIK